MKKLNIIGITLILMGMVGIAQTKSDINIDKCFTGAAVNCGTPGDRETLCTKGPELLSDCTNNVEGDTALHCETVDSNKHVPGKSTKGYFRSEDDSACTGGTLTCKLKIGETVKKAWYAPENGFSQNEAECGTRKKYLSTGENGIGCTGDDDDDDETE